MNELNFCYEIYATVTQKMPKHQTIKKISYKIFKVIPAKLMAV